MPTKKACEKEHDFTLVLTGIADLTPEVQNALFDAGCDDATLSMRYGRPFLTFSRTAGSLKSAIVSAINDVKKARVGLDVVRIDICNLVTQAEIGQRIRRSRQQVHQYITGERGPGGFPSPACHIHDDKDACLWLWCEVAYWLRQNNLITEEVLEDAKVLSLINDVLELKHQRRIEPELTKEILKRLGDPGRPLAF